MRFVNGIFIDDERDPATQGMDMAQNLIRHDTGANFDQQLRDRGISFVAPSAFENGDQAGAQRVAQGANQRFEQMNDFSQNNPELQYQRESARELRGDSARGRAMDAYTSRGIHPNLAGKLTVEEMMGRKRQDTVANRAQYMSTGSGVFDTRRGEIVPGTARAEDKLFEAPGGHNIIREGDFWGTFDPKTGQYDNWKMRDEGGDPDWMRALKMADPAKYGTENTMDARVDFSKIPTRQDLNQAPAAPQPGAAAERNYSAADVERVRSQFPDWDDAKITRYIDQYRGR